MKNNEYRCSCCNEIKSEKDKSLIQWNREEDIDVKICQTCDKKIKKLNYQYLKDFKNKKPTYQHLGECISDVATISINGIEFSTGADGGWPVYVEYDHKGRSSRLIVELSPIYADHKINQN